MEIVEIKCDGCGTMRQWRGYECLTFCDCLTATGIEERGDIMHDIKPTPCIYCEDDVTGSNFTELKNGKFIHDVCMTKISNLHERVVSLRPKDVVYYKYFYGKGYRVFIILEITKETVKAVAINGYVGCVMHFETTEKPFAEVGLGQSVASGLELLTEEKAIESGVNKYYKNKNFINKMYDAFANDTPKDSQRCFYDILASS